MPWKLKQRSNKDVIRKRVYVCPEKTCVHNHPSRALGDLTGIKKHFCRKHGEKKWKCQKCSKRYAVQSDWKAHSKTCGTREYKCDCGTIFSRRDSFITHRAFCDALAEETARVNAASSINNNNNILSYNNNIMGMGPTMNMATHFPSMLKPISNTTHEEEANNQTPRGLSLWNNNMVDHQSHAADPTLYNANIHQFGMNHNNHPPLVSHHHHHQQQQQLNWVFGNSNSNSKLISNNSASCEELTSGSCQQLISVPSLYSSQHHQTTSLSSAANMSATALLQKAAQIGSATSSTTPDPSIFLGSLGFKCTTTTEDDHLIVGRHNMNINNNSNKYCGNMYGSDSVLTSVGGGGSDETDHNTTSPGELSQMHPPKRRQLVHGTEEIAAPGGGQTRDFLGVGVQTICHPSSINGWI
ncbi:zinc finger protein MAGPIE [Senna tora]|uniref:Zinc finger protein MAGPIE n=1 Tax=Senna tora TaxID=362788 RepID=A0A834W6H8_9FABA|nr:zinc finger protein MAGPIE [Senna tora]